MRGGLPGRLGALAVAFEPVRRGSGTVALPSRIDVGDDELALGYSNGATLVDPQRLEPCCTLETPYDYLGVSSTYLRFQDSAAREFVLYRIAGLPC